MFWSIKIPICHQCLQSEIFLCLFSTFSIWDLIIISYSCHLDLRKIIFGKLETTLLFSCDVKDDILVNRFDNNCNISNNQRQWQIHPQNMKLFPEVWRHEDDDSKVVRETLDPIQSVITWSWYPAMVTSKCRKTSCVPGPGWQLAFISQNH